MSALFQRGLAFIGLSLLLSTCLLPDAVWQPETETQQNQGDAGATPGMNDDGVIVVAPPATPPEPGPTPQGDGPTPSIRVQSPASSAPAAMPGAETGMPMSDAGAACSAATDCVSRVCLDGVCATATCSDDVQNQDESDRDCGGRCDACPVSARCNQPSDCSAGVCTAQGCADGVELCCQAPSCNDDVRNGNEPVADCGASPCGLCPLTSPCTANAQCATSRCVGGRCAPPPCLDDILNGTESDTDCGGNDPACARCSVGLDCNSASDCASASCLDGQCTDCNNGEQDGRETGIDCGGSCGLCESGGGCAADADCTSGLCQDGRCCGGNQGDCTRCARRLGSNIDCGTNGPAAQPDCDAFLQCLQDNPTACANRSAETCTASGAVCDPALFGGDGSPGVVLADAILGTAQCQF